MNINLFGISASKAGSVSSVPELSSASRKSDAARVTAAETHKSDTVTISSQGSLQRDAARMSRSVMRDIGRSDEMDSARLESLKARIENHTYQVSGRQVADAMLACALGTRW